MRTLKLTIAYDGTNYAGWQSQPGEPTVQDTLEKAVAKVTGQQVRVVASGRTDAGVHALGQVVAVRTESTLAPDVIRRALNAVLPHDIAVLEATEAADGFHPIRDAVRKRYRYVICDGPVRDVFRRNFVWHYRYGRLDVEAMSRAAAALLGTHDFSSFESSGAQRKTSVRTISELLVERGFGCEIGQGRGGQILPLPDQPSVGARRGAGGEGSATGEGRAGGQETFITIEVESNGFLYNMVRTIVGTLVEVGRGKQPESWPGEVLLATDRRVAGPTAPPQGLCLVRVEY